MSDEPREPGWWKASDGKWYPPDQRPSPPSAPSSQVPREGRYASFLLFGASLAFVVGPFLPWIKMSAPFVGTVTRSGIEGGDGSLFVGLGLAVAFQANAVRTATTPQNAAFVAALLGLVGAGLLIYEWLDISDRVEGLTAGDAPLPAIASRGVGLYLLAGAVVATLVGWGNLVRSSSSRR
ncbi:MAG: hypothetical protein M3314_15625 [Actinomycetota bacterium]|nr:hypothetical protein [Actinomycetota bacterium]